LCGGGGGGGVVKEQAFGRKPLLTILRRKRE
jgi:hypothetical protein